MDEDNNGSPKNRNPSMDELEIEEIPYSSLNNTNSNQSLEYDISNKLAIVTFTDRTPG
jgi:hypothetical protein